MDDSRRAEEIIINVDGAAAERSRIVRNISSNFYRHEDGVGNWGGICTCPDGQEYEVGDNHDGCRSIACEGGYAGPCTKGGISPSSSGMKVTCATGTGQHVNYYRHEQNVGIWGGICTCPDGQSYEVGDEANHCGSIACEGGSAGPCSPGGISRSSHGMKVTCASGVPWPEEPGLLDWTAAVLSRDFVPVDGGTGQACQQDQNFLAPFEGKYYVTRANITSLDDCQSECRRAENICTGLEYRSEAQECRIWKRQIDSGYEAPGSICLKHDPEGFEPVGSGTGEGEACRGLLIGLSEDNGTQETLHKQYSTALENMTLHECKVLCALKQTCSGVEYRQSDGRCNVWMLAISHTVPTDGTVCLRYRQPGFLPQDGGVGKACRGEHAKDEATDRNTILTVVKSMHDCQVHCTRTSFCYGISYRHNGRCEIWTHPMKSSIAMNGSTCLAFEPQASTSLFCASLVVPWTSEPALVEMQLKERLGLFTCEDFAVYSNTELSFGEGLIMTRSLGIDLHCYRGGPFNTFQNTPIFMKFWDRLIKDGEFKSNAWTVKLDPDAVFFADRLRDIVRAEGSPRNAAFLNNCQLGLHGPLEVLSRRTLEVYYAHHEHCPRPGQEDTYLEACFGHLGVQKVDKWDLLAEKDCWRNSFVKDPDWYLCKSAHVAFHPFKQTGSYQWCDKNARGEGHWFWAEHAGWEADSA